MLIKKIDNYNTFKMILENFKTFRNYLSYHKNEYNNIFIDIEKELIRINEKDNLINSHRIYDKLYIKKLKELNLFNLDLNDNSNDFNEFYDILEFLNNNTNILDYVYELENITDIYYLTDFKNFDINITDQYYIIIDYNNKKIRNINENNIKNILYLFLKDYNENINDYNDLIDLDYYLNIFENDINEFIYLLEKELEL